MEQASLEQVQADGGWRDIRPDENQIAADLRQIDPGLSIRFSRAGGCWIVSHVHHGDCPCNRPGGRDGDAYFVTSVQGRQSRVSGVWLGLDGRLVRRMQEINPLGRAGYDYAADLEFRRRDTEARLQAERHELFGEVAERSGHALRKDLGLGPYRGRAFIAKPYAAEED